MGAKNKKRLSLFVPLLGMLCFTFQLGCVLGQTVESTLMISIYGTGRTNNNFPLSDASSPASSNINKFEYIEYFVTDSSGEVSEEALYDTFYLLGGGSECHNCGRVNKDSVVVVEWRVEYG